MAELPTDRTEPQGPFTYSGVDLFGPFYIKKRRSEVKRWTVLFCCMSSRAVHLEITSSLNTDSFINPSGALCADVDPCGNFDATKVLTL